MQIELKAGGELIAAGQVAERTFSSGSRGYQMPFKVVLDGKNYQCQVQLVEVGSKPKA